MKQFRVRNFETVQHYKDRRPPWIKLYRHLWDDPRFFDLSELERYQLISLFVVASQNDNLLPANQDWLKHQILSVKPIPIDKFISMGWLEYVNGNDTAAMPASCSQDASVMLADCKRVDIVEGESEDRGESEERSEEKGISGSPIPPAPAIELHRKVLNEAKQRFGEFKHVLLTPDEHAKLQQRLNGQHQDYIDRLDRWAETEPGKFAKKKNHYAVILTWANADDKKAATAGPSRRYPGYQTHSAIDFTPDKDSGVFQTVAANGGSK